MKKLVILLSVLAVGLTACNNSSNANVDPDAPKKPGKAIRTESDTLSYAIGVDLGHYLLNVRNDAGSDLNSNMVISAMNDILSGKESLTQEQAFAFLQDYYTMRLPVKMKEAEAEFLSQIESQPNVQKTESGLLYEIIEPGSSLRATDLSDEVRVLYRGTLRSGKVFDSSEQHGDTARFALNRVIAGWGEGLQLVGQGGKIKLWIPSELGYGQFGQGPIGPNQPLIFDVELIEVIPSETDPSNNPV